MARPSPRDVTTLVLAGGRGARVGGEQPKQLLDLGDGRCVLDLVLDAYQSFAGVGAIVLVAPPDFAECVRSVAGAYPKVAEVVDGGGSRQASAQNGLARVTSRYVVIHEAARPLVRHETLERCLERIGAGARAVATVFPTANTIAQVEGGRIVAAHARGSRFWVQSPLAFETDLIRSCYEKAAADGHMELPAETQLVARYAGEDVHVVKGEASGFKITHPEDFALLHAWLAKSDA